MSFPVMILYSKYNLFEFRGMAALKRLLVLMSKNIHHLCTFHSIAEDQVVVSSDYDSTHEANHSDSSDIAHTEEDTEEGKTPPQNVILHPLIPPEVI